MSRLERRSGRIIIVELPANRKQEKISKCQETTTCPWLLNGTNADMNNLLRQ